MLQENFEVYLRMINRGRGRKAFIHWLWFPKGYPLLTPLYFRVAHIQGWESCRELVIAAQLE